MKKIMILLVSVLLMCSVVLAVGNDADTVLLLSFDDSGNFPDPDSAAGGLESPHDMTANGDVAIDTVNKYFGAGASYFDGTSDYLSSGNSADWHVGNGDFTIDAWIRPASVSGTLPIFEQYAGNNDRMLFYTSGSDIKFLVSSGGPGYIIGILAGPHGMSANNWYHVALVRSGSNYTIYVDGNSIASEVDGSPIPDFNSPLYIGTSHWDYATTASFNGRMDEYRISDVARWTSDFTPPTEPYETELGPGEEGIIPETDNMIQIFVLLIVALLIGVVVLKKDKN